MFLWSIGSVQGATNSIINNENFLDALKKHEDQVKSLQADMEMIIIISREAKFKQKGKYYYLAPNKLRINYEVPVQQSMILIGQKVYMKPVGSSEFIESDDNDFQGKLYSSDLYGYYYLNRFVYDPRTNAGHLQKSDHAVYMGYEIVDGKKEPRVKVYYNRKEGLVKEYSIVGNAVAPATRIKYKYEKINGIMIPTCLYISVNYQMGQGKSVVKLKNVVVNAIIDENVFMP